MHKIKKELLNDLKEEYKRQLQIIENSPDFLFQDIQETLDELSNYSKDDKLSDYENVSNLNKKLEYIERVYSINLYQMRHKYKIFWLQDLKIKEDDGGYYE